MTTMRLIATAFLTFSNVAMVAVAAAPATGGSSDLPLSQTAPVAFSESSIKLPRYGDVAIYRPAGGPKSIVIFLSGDGGWHLGVVDMARRFAGEGALVAGFDVRRYLASLRPAGDAADTACANTAADMEALSQLLQRSLKLDVYRHPFLVGYSSGATVVYAALAQAPRGTFAGVFSFGFCADQDFSGAKLCRVNGLDYTLPASAKPDNHSLILKPDSRLRDPWVAVQGERDQVCDAGNAREFTQQVSGSQLLSLPQVGHGFAVTRSWWPQVRTVYQNLVTASAPQKSTDADVSDLPIYETRASGTASPRIAILLTGDGGWAGLDQDIAADLAGRGIATAALSSVRYFWQVRTPEESAKDVTRMVEHYLLSWNGERVLLIGYSFGADVLPFVYNRLPDGLRSRIDSVSLLGFSSSADFEMKVAGWLPGSRNSGVATLPEVQKLAAVPTLCVRGDNEADSACGSVSGTNARTVRIGSGHHFSGKTHDIVDAILETANSSRP